MEVGKPVEHLPLLSSKYCRGMCSHSSQASHGTTSAPKTEPSVRNSFLLRFAPPWAPVHPDHNHIYRCVSPIQHTAKHTLHEPSFKFIKSFGYELTPAHEETVIKRTVNCHLLALVTYETAAHGCVPVDRHVDTFLRCSMLPRHLSLVFFRSTPRSP